MNGGQAVAREKFLHKRKVKQSSCYKMKTKTGCLVEAQDKQTLHRLLTLSNKTNLCVCFKNPDYTNMRLISNHPVQAHLSILDLITLVLLTLTLETRLVCISLCPRQHLQFRFYVYLMMVVNNLVQLQFHLLQLAEGLLILVSDIQRLIPLNCLNTFLLDNLSFVLFL